MKFDVAGPFKLTRHGTKKLITDQSLTELKAELERCDSGLSKACGCYVFAIHTPKGYTPYYVGQASKQSIVGEALNPSNREKYNKACSESKGSPTIFLLPKLTPKGRYKKKGRVSATIDFLELAYSRCAPEESGPHQHQGNAVSEGNIRCRDF